MNKTYAMAYTEILEILKYLPKEEYDKIPKEKIDFFEKNKDNNYTYKFDTSKSLNEQNVSKKTNTIIVDLFMKYFASNEQKEQIKIILDKNEVQKQQKLREKYNPDNIFDNKQVSSNINIKEFEQTDLKKYTKMPWYKRIFNKIKSILSK